MSSKYAKIVRVTRNKNGKGNNFTVKQLTEDYNNQFKELANVIKEYYFSLLDASGKHKIRRDKHGMFNETTVDFTTDGLQFNLPEYAQYLEAGRKAGGKKVPIQVLVKWLKRYRVISRSKKTGRFTKVSEKSIISTAFAIQRAIWKNGKKPRKAIESTLKFAEDIIEESLNVIAEDIISIIDFAINKK